MSVALECIAITQMVVSRVPTRFLLSIIRLSRDKRFRSIPHVRIFNPSFYFFSLIHYFILQSIHALTRPASFFFLVDAKNCGKMLRCKLKERS